MANEDRDNDHHIQKNFWDFGAEAVKWAMPRSFSTEEARQAQTEVVFKDSSYKSDRNVQATRLGAVGIFSLLWNNSLAL